MPGSAGRSGPCAAPAGRPRRPVWRPWPAWHPSRASPWSACRRPTCRRFWTSWPRCGCRAVTLLGGGTGAAALDGEEARAARAAARSARAAADRPGSGRRDRARAAAQHGLGHGRCRRRATSPSSPSRIRSPRPCSNGRPRGRSASRASRRWASVPRCELGDILDYLALDLATRAILIHLEGIADARRFMSAARAAARIKPVLVLKAGPAGRPAGGAARRHRPAPAPGPGLRRRLRPGGLGPGRLDRGAVRRCRQPGPGRYAPRPRAAQGQAGAADQRPWAGRARGRRAAAGGGTLVRPTPPIHAAITAAVGEVASLASSVDLGPDAGGDAYAAALDVLLETPDLDAVLVIHAPAAGVDPGEVAAAVAATADRRKPRSSQRPVLAAWLGEDRPGAGAGRRSTQAAIPIFTTPEAAVRAFLYRVQHERRQFVLRQVPTSRPDSPLDRQRAASLIDRGPGGGPPRAERGRSHGAARRLRHPERADPGGGRSRRGRRGRARARLPGGAQDRQPAPAAEELGRRRGAGHRRQGLAAAPWPAHAGAGGRRRSEHADRGPAGTAHGALPVSDRALSRHGDRPDLRAGAAARPRRAAGDRHRHRLPPAAAGHRPWPTPCSTRRRSAASWPADRKVPSCWPAWPRSWCGCPTSSSSSRRSAGSRSTRSWSVGERMVVLDAHVELVRAGRRRRRAAGRAALSARAGADGHLARRPRDPAAADPARGCADPAAAVPQPDAGGSPQAACSPR